LEYRLEDLDRMLAVNLRAVFVVTQAAVKHMKAGGRVITIGNTDFADMLRKLMALPRYGAADEIAHWSLILQDPKQASSPAQV